tara:strand:+ start:1305 stop:1409 length:105 start_codon:yes stop_codon:yes gene_type:complete
MKGGYNYIEDNSMKGKKKVKERVKEKERVNKHIK